MKSFETKNLGIEILRYDELVNTRGGGFWAWVAGCIAGGILYDLVSNPGHNSDVVAAGRHAAMEMY